MPASGTMRAQEAQTPQDIPARGWREVAGRVYEEIGKDRVAAVAAGVTLYGLLALFPMIGAFVSLYGLVADPASNGAHLAAMSQVLPGGAVEVIGDQVKRIASQPGGRLGFSFLAGLAVSLWSANAGVKASFFLLGTNVDKFPGTVTSEFQAQHSLNSHGYSHADFLKLALSEVCVCVCVHHAHGRGRRVHFVGRCFPSVMIVCVL